MAVRLSDHFTPLRLIRFTCPTMGMLILTSLYTIVDGYFVSNYVGKTAFVAVNLIFPFIMIPATLGTMIGTGGSALVAKTLGRGKVALARSRFSLLVYFAVVTGTALSFVWLVFLEPCAVLLGAEGEVLEACKIYGWVLIPGLTPMILQFMFQSFFPLAGRPQLGLWVTFAAGVTNILFDYLLILVFGWGLLGAAIATVGGMLVGAVPPLLFFALSETSELRIGRAALEWRAIVKSCTNGASEFMSNVSMSLISILYNFLLLKMAGENGVAVYGLLMYIGFMFIAIFLGFGFGAIPVIAYHYGARNTPELKSLLRYSLAINLALGILLSVAGLLLSPLLARLFLGYDPELARMAEHASVIYSFSFIFAGVNIFVSSFYTALNNGLFSAAVSFVRTLALQAVAVVALPFILGLNGIWAATPVAEVLTLFFALPCLYYTRKEYGYL